MSEPKKRGRPPSPKAAAVAAYEAERAEAWLAYQKALPAANVKFLAWKHGPK